MDYFLVADLEVLPPPNKNNEPPNPNKPNTQKPDGDVLGGAGDFSAVSLSYTNQKRAETGKGSLTRDPQLDADCKEQTNLMAEKRQMTHYLYPSKGAGENISMGYGSHARALDGWWNSPGHKANMLRSNYTKYGASETGNWRCQRFK